MSEVEYRVIAQHGGSIQFFGNGKLYKHFHIDAEGNRTESEEFVPNKFPRPEHDCRVYWGSHGCHLERSHDGHHWCDCCECEGEHTDAPDDEGTICVASFPYYGPDTNFYGEDA